MTTPRDNETSRPVRDADDRIENLLRETGPAELPPFFRPRLLARLRGEEAGRRARWLRSPALAWAVAGAAVVALLVVTMRTRGPVPPTPADEGAAERVIEEAVASAPEIEPVVPEESSVVGAGDVEIVAAITPRIEGAVIRLLVDEEDVTGLAEITADYVSYSPAGRFAEGEHIITIEIRDSAGARIKDYTWLFYTLDGKNAPDERV